MKKLIQNTCLLVCAGVLAVFMVVVLANISPIEIQMPLLTKEKVEEEMKEAEQAAKVAQRRQRINRIYSCKVDDDCVIVEKDPCGCSVGPQGVIAVNVAYITEFNEMNSNAFGTKTCPEEVSIEKECSTTL